MPSRWICRLVLSLLLALTGLPGLAADTPVVPNASPEAQALLSFLSDTYGKRMLSGQQESWRGANELGPELTYLKDTTGKLPAILGLDLMSSTRASEPRRRRNQHHVAIQAVDWITNRNGIVTFCWHWFAPVGDPAFYSKDTRFDLTRGLTEGTPEHAAILRDLDAVAGELQVLRDAHVPVLWRPLHEMNGRWFWWGDHGPEAMTKLWRLMFDRFTYQHGLTNLLWVFSPGAATDLADWYPGDAYVDLIGQDHYPMDGNNGPAKEVFDELVALGRSKLPVGMSENGPIPDPDRVVNEKADWLFFITWSGDMLREKNTKEQLRKVFNHPHVMNLGDLPPLVKYPFRPAGKAVKLAFPAAPGPAAVNGLRRLPITVAVQDDNGRTVRTGSFKVTLALAGNLADAKLTGTLAATAVNGVATFADVTIAKPGSNYSFTAVAEGLQSATCPAFEIGPGDGIERVWWTGQTNLAAPPASPAGREIFSKAFEAPVRPGTNFVARFRGFVLPPTTGSYEFTIANDGVSQLWLSSDATAAHKSKIAEITTKTPYSKWPHTHEASSGPVQLEAGRRYFLEILQHQPAGYSHLSMRWRLPDGREERPIPGNRLALPNAN